MAGPLARRATRLAVTAAVATATAALSLGSAAAAAPDAPERSTGKPAPVVGTNNPRAIPDRYIVVLDKDLTAAQAGRRRPGQGNGGKVHLRYGNALKGFAATLPAPRVDRLRHNPNVAYIEADQTVSVDDDPDAGDVGPRPHRPAQPAAEQQLHLQRRPARA